MLIIGAGLAGLLAGHWFRHYNPTILERSAELPNNHGAILRFRSPAIQDITGAPMKKVTVRKAILERNHRLEDRCTLLHANAYARKVSGIVQPRSIVNLEPMLRWIPDKGFTTYLARGLDISYNSKFNPQDAYATRNLQTVHISTAPMKMWTDYMELEVEYKTQPITVIETELNDVDVHQTLYIPWDGWLPYRASVVGNRMIIEIMGEEHVTGDAIQNWINIICKALFDYIPHHGEVSIKHQKLGKIVPLPGPQRRELISLITERFNVYSLGRFATWRNILLGDVIDDCKVIDNLIQTGAGRYARQLHYAGE